MFQKIIETLDEKYQRREQEARVLSAAPPGSYVCIRLDGFNATRTFLRDHVANEAFSKVLYGAYKALFSAFRHHLNREYTSSIVVAYMANDEVSIVLNRDNDNYERRLMKWCTLFAGMLSSSATFELHRQNDIQGLHPRHLLAFDARPILLNSEEEILEYIRLRYLMSRRYASWKVLRLRELPDVNEDRVKLNMDNAEALVREQGLTQDVRRLIRTYKIFLPEKKPRPECLLMDVEPEGVGLEHFADKLRDYLTYLHSTRR